MGGSGGGAQTTTIPPPPSYGSQVKKYIKNYPKLFALRQQYSIPEAQVDYDTFTKFAPQYMQQAIDLQNKYYPYTSGLQESVAKQAATGLNEAIPREYLEQYMSDFNAGVGQNVNAPIGVSDRNIGLMRLRKEWQDYYRNLALTTAGRQPLEQPYKAGEIQFKDPREGFKDLLNYTASTYGSYAGGLAGASYANAYAGAQNQQAGMQRTGAVMGAIGGLFCWVASELYGGWFHPKTIAARAYIANEAPSWFRDWYVKNGLEFSIFLRQNVWMKRLIQPLFDWFAKKGQRYL